MICRSDPWTPAELESIRIGYEIHRDVLAEGGREGVYSDLDHDLIGSGKLPFVKFDHRTGETHRRFSKPLAERIKANAWHLKVYFEYVKKHDRAVGGKILTARVVGSSNRR